MSHAPRSLRSKLLTAILLCWVIPVLVIFGLTVLFVGREYRQTARSILETDAEGALQQTKLLFSQAFRVSKEVTYDGVILAAYQSYRDNGDIAAELSAIGETHAADLQVQASSMDISMMSGSGISAEITGEDIDTLQAIAVGYVVAALLFVYFRPRWQIVAGVALFAAYWLAFACTGMNLDPQDNIAMVVDKAVLGSHRDGVRWAADGTWRFGKSYQYTWILSSLNFAVTVLLGCFAGQLLNSGKLSPARRALWVAVTGAALVAAGLALSPVFPIVKKIWSSSMTLFSGGICFLLTAFTYDLVDVRGWHRGADWLKIYGMNAITAYCIGEVVRFTSVSESLLHGFGSLPCYPVIIAFADAAILFGILAVMYKHKVFLKV